MKTTGIFTLHEYKIPVRQGAPVYLNFFGDVHRDSYLCADEAWQRFLDTKRDKPDQWFLGMGDYLDSTSTSERSAWARACLELHETKKRDVEIQERLKAKKFAKEIGFMKGRLIGLVGGNHYFKFEDGTTSDNIICQELGCKFLGVSSFIRLTLEVGGKATWNNRVSLDIWVHHGKGAGRLLGGSINSVDQMREHAEADIYAMGHDHKRAVIPAMPRLALANAAQFGLKLRQRQQWLCRTGSFLRSYEDGEASYNVDASRGPTSIGHVELEITYSRPRDEDHRKRSTVTIRGIS